MAPTLQILVNGLVNADTDCPLSSPVTLTAQASGVPVLTYDWKILTQPAAYDGTLVFDRSGQATSELTSETITPTCQGTVLVSLVVNADNPATLLQTTAILGVRQVKTQTRVPAIGETTETGPDGWADEENVFMQLVDSTRADPGSLVAGAGSGTGQNIVVRFNSTVPFLSGLPEQQIVPSLQQAFPSDPDIKAVSLGIVTGPVSGSTITSEGQPVNVKFFGEVNLGVLSSPPAGLTPLFLNTDSTVTATPTARQVGVSMGTATDGNSYMFFDGTVGASSSPFSQPGGVGTAIQPNDTTSSTQLDRATATGTNSFAAAGGSATAGDAVAIGLFSQASSGASIALGVSAVANGDSDGGQGEDVAIGLGQTNASHSMAIGSAVTENGADHSTAIGGSFDTGDSSELPATANGRYSFALHGGQAFGTGSIAIGLCSTSSDFETKLGNDGSVSGSVSNISFNSDGAGKVKISGSTIDLEGMVTGSTVGAPGSASALPVAPLGYLTVTIGGNVVKIPFYNH